MLRAIGVTLLCALLAYLVLGVQPRDLHADTDPAAQRALDAVTTEIFGVDDPASNFPADFVAVMGYRPVVARSAKGNPILIKATGDCSAFSGQTKYTFGLVCKEHDLAYDVLRYSAAVHRPLPATSRLQADAMFRRELHNNCTHSQWTGLDFAMCHAWAESFALAVDFNSWRQGDRPPVRREATVEWLSCTGLFVVLLISRRRLEILDREPFALLLPDRR